MSRIINRQRQLAEQGRLRLGYTVAAKKKNGDPTTRPVRSETWIVTSHSEEHVRHAAALWGGEAHEWEPMGNGAKQWRVITEAKTIPAILPPGDPLTSAYESWSKGGCQRRCNGVTESFSGSPCICLAQHGEQWYELSAREVCVSKSRLKVLLPDMPGLGSWRMETGSFYATDEIAGMVDTIRGAVGENVLVPVQLRIEPRTRVAGGQTKQFVVPVVELRGVTAGALLSGQAIETRALTSGDVNSTTPLALQTSAAGEDAYTPFLARVAAANSLEQLHGLWAEMIEAKLVGTHSVESQRRAEFFAVYKARGESLSTTAEPSAAPKVNEDGTVDAEIVEDPPAAAAPSAEPVDAEVVWAEIVATAAKRGLSKLPDLQDDCATFLGISAGEASGEELGMYLEELRKRPEVAA